MVSIAGSLKNATKSGGYGAYTLVKTTREGIAVARALMANFKKNKITPNIWRKNFSTVQIAWGVGVWTK